MADLYFGLDDGNLDKLEVDDITNNGVQALSKQPKRPSAFGEGGLSSDELKARFDKLPTLLAQKINAIIAALGDGGENIQIALGGKMITLAMLGEKIKDGTFADEITVSYGDDACSLQLAIDNLLKSISDIEDDIESLEEQVKQEKDIRESLALELEFDKYSQTLKINIRGLEGAIVASGSVNIPDREIQRLKSPVGKHEDTYSSTFGIEASDGGTYVDGYRIYVAYEVNGAKKVAILGIEKPAADETVTFDLSLLASREGLKPSALFEQGAENTFSVTAVGLGMLESEPREITWVGWITSPEVKYENGVAVGIGEEVEQDYLGEGALVITGKTSDGVTVTDIGEGAFMGKTGYTSLWLPPTVKTVSKNAFKNCSGITRVNVPSLAEYCGIDFMNSGAAPLYNGINEEGKADAKADLYCDGKKVEGALEIPAGVEKIGARAFYYLTAITSLKIPDSVKAIGASAFCGCLSLKDATIGKSVTVLPSGLFYNCPNLEEVSLPDGLKTIGDEAFSTCKKLQQFKIPESVTSIGEKAFYNDSNIKSLIIPESVTYIGENAFYGVDVNLAELSLPFIGRTPDDSTYYFLGSIFGKSAASTSCCQKLNKLTLTPSDNGCVLKSGALTGATKVTTLNIEGGKAEIRAGAIPSRITMLKVDGTALTVGQNAFSGTGIKKFCIGDVRAYCESYLDSSSSNGGEPEQYPYNSPLNSNSEAFLADEDGNPLSELYIPDGTKSINTHAFYRPWSHRDENIKKISLPGSLKSIGGRGLMGQRGVTEIEFRGSEDEAEDLTLGFYALVNMPSLKNLYLPDRVKSIGRYALHSNSYNKMRINTTGCEISSDALVGSTVKELYLTCSETEAYNKGYPWGATVNAVHYNSTVTAKEF